MKTTKNYFESFFFVLIFMLPIGLSSCDDEKEDIVGSRDLLLGVWNGVYYLTQEWEDGEMVGGNKEDFVNGTNRYSIEFKGDGTYVEKEVYKPTGSTSYNSGTWEYSGNKLVLMDSADEESGTWVVTKMTETELVYEDRAKEKDDGFVYEYCEQFVFVR